MDAAATEYFRAHFLAVVADQTSSVVAIGRADWSAVVACADDLILLDDDRPHCLFQTGGALLED